MYSAQNEHLRCPSCYHILTVINGVWRHKDSNKHQVSSNHYAINCKCMCNQVIINMYLATISRKTDLDSLPIKEQPVSDM